MTTKQVPVDPLPEEVVDALHNVAMLIMNQGKLFEYPVITLEIAFFQEGDFRYSNVAMHESERSIVKKPQGTLKK